ncbi:DNA internalization-related competence protein ComEC/Rec2 [Idiomarina sp. 29L]|uniref:DNA internalization-related competence protein ComEC/Rec2 n=1 Tax=Idiomarina sp. 29L TaxID=2508877 RepID=UPI001010D014|nr:DNA internalization-related competence protein ComEC/Rec2 [Idiomarina sp. 29L]RXS41879.1 DNA internalization-related competence protein ComEC/Rec2 [Idiomarina sp. 29L]
MDLKTIRLLLIVVFCGISWVNANLYWQEFQSLPSEYFDSEHDIQITLDEIPQVYQYHTRITGRVLRARDFLPSWYQDIKVRLNLYTYDESIILKAGDTIQGTAIFKVPKSYRNDGSFNYKSYLMRQGISATGSIKNVSVVSRSPTIRQQVFDTLKQAKLEFGGVIAALTIGERSLLSLEVKEAWQKTGLAHSLAISGLHIGMVVGAVFLFVSFCFRYLPVGPGFRERYNKRLICACVGILVAVFYAFLADFAISTVRALVLAGIVLMHKLFAVRVSPLQFLLRTSFGVFVIDPFAWQDAGFWLSICAVTTLFFSHWRWRSKAGRMANLRQLWFIQWVLLIIMAPLSVYLFGGFSLFAPLVNLLVLPLISFWILPLSLIGTLCSLFDGSRYAQWLWYIAEQPLVYIMPYLNQLSVHPWNWLAIDTLAATRDARFGALWALIIVFTVPVVRVWQRILLVVCLPLATYVLLNQRDGQLRIHVLDVGQSQAIVVERNGRALLMDTGVSYHSGFSVAEQVIEPFLRYHGLVPELVIISHKDNDHSGGKAYLEKRYPGIKWFGATTDKPCLAGQTNYWNELSLHTYWPTASYKKSGQLSRNNESCVVQLRWHEFTMLFPGDIEMGAEQSLLASVRSNEVLNSTILTIPHHGSKTSTSWPLLQAVDAEAYVISYGKHRGYNFPHRYTIGRLQRTGAPWFGTQEVGQITITSNGYSWSLELPHENR